MASASVDFNSEKNGMSESQEMVVSWGTSALLHLGIGLLIIGAMYAVGKSRSITTEIPVPPYINPKDVDIAEASLSGLKNSEIQQDPFQDLIKDVPNPGKDVNGSLAGMIDKKIGIKGLENNDFISLGMNAGTKNGDPRANTFGDGIGLIAPHGRPQSWLSPFDGKPQGNGRLTKVAFVLDHSGSMIDTFDFLRDEVKRTVGHYGGAQQFSVIMFSEQSDVKVLGPDHLQLALPSVKSDLFNQLDQIRASGKNDDLLEPFTKALGRAFAMNPQVIVFLTDGNFDERLPNEVARMNKDKKVKINTIAFVRISKRSQEQLQNIARDNGGKYKFVSIQDLGR
jgi:hypothetical protein